MHPPDSAGHPDFNPRSPCGERPYWWPRRSGPENFNPRSPCGERPAPPGQTMPRRRFQSTLPVWGATNPVRQTGCNDRISIHAPRVGSDLSPPKGASTPKNFNPRSPCGERRAGMLAAERAAVFQSTLPVWGATPAPGEVAGALGISIHAPRVGSDQIQFPPAGSAGISIHAPRVGSDRAEIEGITL